MYYNFFSLACLVRALERSGQTLHIDVLTDRLHEVAGEGELRPGAAPLLGLLKVIPQEYPGIVCRNIDICWPGAQDPRAGWYIAQVTAELRGDAREPEVAFRWRNRWVRTFEPLNMEHAPRRQNPLKERGVYLITGGLGELGLIIARHLARTVHARLVLTGRSAFPQPGQWDCWQAEHAGGDAIGRKIEKLREIRRMGAEVLTVQADAADLEQMTQVFDRAGERFGPVQGVIHAAGVTRGDSIDAIARLTRGAAHEQFKPKIQGIRVLARLLENREVDFCILFSSLSTILGGLGLGAYSAANCYMDAFVDYYNRRGSQPWLSVDWEGWHPDTDNALEGFSQRVMELIMMPREGEKAFHCILELAGISRVAVSVGDLDSRVREWVNPRVQAAEEMSREENEKTPAERPDISTPYAPPGTVLEQTIARIWQTFFGFKVGIGDDFFDLGGDSLKAMTVIGAIYKETGTEISMAGFFAAPTVAALAKYIEGNAQKNEYRSIPPAEEREYYPLSPAQKRMYILLQTNPDDLSYNMDYVLRLEGVLEPGRLAGVFQRLVQRHESLRTSFELLDGQPVQRVHEQVAVEFEPAESIGSFARPFDLSRAPLLRVGLIKQDAGHHLLLVDMPHIIYDGISIDVLFQDICTYYRDEEPAPLSLRCTDYAVWCLSHWRQQRLETQEAYWLKVFSGNIPVLELPTDYPRPALRSHEGAVERFEISSGEAMALRALAKEEDVTMFMVLLALFNILLARISGQQDIVVGTPAAGRKQPGLQDIIGLFLNALALRNFPGADKSVRAFLGEVREATLAAFDNEDYSFEALAQQVSGAPDPGRSPLFDVMVIFHNEVRDHRDHVRLTPHLTISHYPAGKKASMYDLTLSAMENRDRILLNFEYCTALFKPGTIRRMIEDFKRIVEQVVENKSIKIKDIKLDNRPEVLEKANLDFQFNI